MNVENKYNVLTLTIAIIRLVRKNYHFLLSDTHTHVCVVVQNNNFSKKNCVRIKRMTPYDFHIFILLQIPNGHYKGLDSILLSNMG